MTQSSTRCKLGCRGQATYSERGHWLAGDYCDLHGLAVHRLRRGSPCPCGHCAEARVRIERHEKKEATDRDAERAARVEEDEDDGTD